MPSLLHPGHHSHSSSHREVTFSPDVDHLLTSTDAKVFALLDAHIEDPTFDVFEADRASGGRGLYYMGWYVMRRHGMFTAAAAPGSGGIAGPVALPEGKFRRWLAHIEEGYRPTNPYHNAMHAADVTHAMHYYVTRPRLWQFLTWEERLAGLLAPIIHDYMHPGVNNAFLIATMHPLAVRYNDQAVLEHFHCATVFETMASDPSMDILAPLSVDSRKAVRELVVSMVLATDMAMHFDWIGKFKTKLNGSGFNCEVKLDRKTLLNVAIKCADVNNPTKTIELSKKWTDMIMEEFFMQGDEEKRLGLPISMMNNRESTDVPKCQIGFIDFIVFPLFEAWSCFMLEDVKVQMENILANKAYWKALADAAAGVPPPTQPPPPQPASASGSASQSPQPILLPPVGPASVSVFPPVSLPQLAAPDGPSEDEDLSM
ncbi:hypothetical protein DFJ73DRAFT_656215 [Zopfochytrium polystomum]|nr:hypothetical protein DFJ73DRAFT_656215 [Zopfochytrium polystomum]